MKGSVKGHRRDAPFLFCDQRSFARPARSASGRWQSPPNSSFQFIVRARLAADRHRAEALRRRTASLRRWSEGESKDLRYCPSVRGHRTMADLPSRSALEDALDGARRRTTTTRASPSRASSTISGPASVRPSSSAASASSRQPSRLAGLLEEVDAQADWSAGRGRARADEAALVDCGRAAHASGRGVRDVFTANHLVWRNLVRVRREPERIGVFR